jgi:hypothetical protein
MAWTFEDASRIYYLSERNKEIDVILQTLQDLKKASELYREVARNESELYAIMSKYKPQPTKEYIAPSPWTAEDSTRLVTIIAQLEYLRAKAAPPTDPEERKIYIAEIEKLMQEQADLNAKYSGAATETITEQINTLTTEPVTRTTTAIGYVASGIHDINADIANQLNTTNLSTQQFGNTIQISIENLMKMGGDLLNQFNPQSLIDAVTGAIGELGKGFSDFLANPGEFIGNMVKGASDALTTFWGDLSSQIPTFFTDLLTNYVAPLVESATKGITDFLKPITDPISDFISKLPTNIIDLFGGIGKSVDDAFSNINLDLKSNIDKLLEWLGLNINFQALANIFSLDPLIGVLLAGFKTLSQALTFNPKDIVTAFNEAQQAQVSLMTKG